MNERAPVTDWARDFDHLDPRWAQDPHSIWRELRQTCPVAHTDRFDGVYFPSRYEDVRAVAYDTEHFSSRRVSIREGKPVLPPSPPVTSDPPAHRDDRKILIAPFTPQSVAKLEPKTRAICRELLERLSDRKECDAAVDYAQEIPSRVTAYLLGTSEHEGPRFRKWARDFLELGAADPAVTHRVLAEVDAFFAKEISTRKAAPGDDLISYLLDAKVHGQPLNEEHIRGTTRLLFFAGIDTTWSMIGASLWHLATHEDDRKRLVAEPNLIPTAIEEFLRAYAPVAVAREVVKETEIGGCPLKEGEMVMLAYGAANRDPAMFPNADRVIIDRAENRHATFGLGIHRCIGSNLARMEIRVALEEWLGRFPDFVLSDAAEVKWSAGTVRGPRQIPITIGR
ncbi:cytochrome P450 [Bradyrhizobium sp. AZCC 2230]|uniref:cytochrome P450 n=1 Tax=Bradyrhizobium sp. AZCC 2230 TaxID=3117021 RepID=UPI002FF1BFEA